MVVVAVIVIVKVGIEMVAARMVGSCYPTSRSKEGPTSATDSSPIHDDWESVRQGSAASHA